MAAPVAHEFDRDSVSPLGDSRLRGLRTDITYDSGFVCQRWGKVLHRSHHSDNVVSTQALGGHAASDDAHDGSGYAYASDDDEAFTIHNTSSNGDHTYTDCTSRNIQTCTRIKRFPTHAYYICMRCIEHGSNLLQPATTLAS